MRQGWESRVKTEVEGGEELYRRMERWVKGRVCVNEGMWGRWSVKGNVRGSDMGKMMGK